MTTLTQIIGSERGNQGRDNPICNPVDLANEVTQRLHAEKRQAEIEAKKAKLKQSDAALENKVDDDYSKVNLFSDCEIIVAPKYRDAMIDAENFATKNNSLIASMPQLIQALTNPEIRKKVRSSWASTTSAEYQGKNSKGENLYVVAHGLGPLSNTKGLEKYLPLAEKKYGFMPIESVDLKSVLENAVSISDILKENIPKNENYSIIINLDKDSSHINASSKLSKHNFLTDDRVLAVCGSLENRETLANILFNSKDMGGEGHTAVGSYHRIKEFGFNAKTSGRPLYLFSGNNGLYGDNDYYNFGRFVLVTPEAHQTQNNKDNTISNNK